MSGTTLFLLGAIAFSNISLLIYLLSDRNKRAKFQAEETPSEEKAIANPDIKSEKEETEPLQKPSFVGKSKFNIDDIDAMIEKRINEKVEERVNRLVEEKLGDVLLKDVEFTNDEDKPTSEELSNDVFVPKPRIKEARMSKEQEDASFNDLRIEDVEPDLVSAPSANGSSMDEIEKSLSDAVNPDASAEDKIAAGKVLEPLLDTNFVELFTTDAAIFEAIKDCITESLKGQIYQAKMTNQVSTPRKTATSNPEPAVVIKRQTEVYIAPTLDDFNPDDLLP